MAATSNNVEKVVYYVIRHAESTNNVAEGPTEEHFGVQLTDNGKEQASELGEYLRSLGVTFDRVYCSPYKRTQDTAVLALQQWLPGFRPASLLISDEISEQDRGDFGTWPREKIRDFYRAMAADGFSNWDIIPGDKVPGESKKQVAKRMRNFFENTVPNSLPQEIQAASLDGTVTIAVFTHGNAIKFLKADALDEERPLAIHYDVRNVSVHKYIIERVSTASARVSLWQSGEWKRIHAGTKK